MSHNIFGKKLNRDTGQRQALLKGLAGALIRSEAIETTEAKALAARTLIEKLITQAKRGNLTDIREIEGAIIDKDLVYKLVHTIAPRFKTRTGGFMRLVKLGNRAGDNAPMVRMELLAETAVAVTPAPSTTAKAETSVAAKKTPAKSTKSRASSKTKK
jgi:large subunit ribosomal protein L17